MKKDRLRKKLEEESEDLYDIDEDSDLPIHEKFVKEKRIKKIKGDNSEDISEDNFLQ